MITINLTLTGTNLKNGYCYGQTKKETKEKLFQEKNIVSKLYALGGLYFTDHSQFQILVQDFKTFGYTLETVTTEEGCITDRFTVAEFVVFLEDGHWPEIWRGDISF